MILWLKSIFRMSITCWLSISTWSTLNSDWFLNQMWQLMKINDINHENFKVKHVKPLDFLRTKLIKYVFKSTVAKRAKWSWAIVICQYYKLLTFQFLFWYRWVNASTQMKLNLVIILFVGCSFSSYSCWSFWLEIQEGQVLQLTYM